MSRLGKGVVTVHVEQGQIDVNLEGDLNGKIVQQIPKFLFKAYRQYKRDKIRGVKKEELTNDNGKLKQPTATTTK